MINSDLDRRTTAFKKLQLSLTFQEKPTSLMDSTPQVRTAHLPGGESDNNKFVKHRDWLKSNLHTIYNLNTKDDPSLEGTRKGLVARIQRELLLLDEFQDQQWLMLKARTGITAAHRSDQPQVIITGIHDILMNVHVAEADR